MGELLARLAEKADVVIVDSPPSLPVTDAAVLARQVDAVLLVLDAGKTRRWAAAQALEGLRQVDANVIGVVLNNVPTRGMANRYYYYYYYREYYDDGTGQRVRKRRNRRPRQQRSLLGRLLRSKPRQRPSNPTAPSRSTMAIARSLSRRERVGVRARPFFLPPPFHLERGSGG